MRLVLLLAVLAVAVAVLSAGCGGDTSSGGAASSGPVQVPQPSSARLNGRQQRELAQLRADIARVRKASTTVTHRSLMGTPALMKATSVFLDHEEAATLPLKTKNRLIDLAAAPTVGTCDQCFQMLEANRPIPQIKYH
jgi:hypothetical protein